MNPAQVFSAVNGLAMLQWFLLIFLPKWKFTQWTVDRRIIPLSLAVIYGIYIAAFFNTPGAGFASIDQVRSLFNHNGLLLAGWVHYLCFDLLTGFYILQSARKRFIPHLWVVPCLMLTFMFGPCGYLLYQVIKKIRTRDEKVI